MADKGFLIQDLLKAKNAGLVIPPFLGAKGKFSKNEVSMTHDIARLRIHGERAIRKVKEYHIFDGVIPLNLAPSIKQIRTVCYSDKFSRTVILRKLLGIVSNLCISILFNSPEFACICILKFND